MNGVSNYEGEEAKEAKDKQVKCAGNNPEHKNGYLENI